MSRAACWIVVALIAFGTYLAVQSERKDTHLATTCELRVKRAFEACQKGASTGSRAHCAEALMDLELLEDNATVWRPQWIGATAAALVPRCGAARCAALALRAPRAGPACAPHSHHARPAHAPHTPSASPLTWLPLLHLSASRACPPFQTIYNSSTLVPHKRNPYSRPSHSSTCGTCGARAVPGPTRFDPVPPGSIWVNQVPPGSTRVPPWVHPGPRAPLSRLHLRHPQRHQRGPGFVLPPRFHLFPPGST
jgi:hypothetical protein